MNNSIPFDQFEKYFNEFVLESGQSLAEDKHSWKINYFSTKIQGIYQVSQMPPIYVDIEMTSKFILSYICSCPDFNQSKGCRHITAVLLIKKNQSQRLTSVRSRNKISNDQILDVVNKTELDSFVRFYSNNNLSFSKILKQFFQYKFYYGTDGFRAYLDSLVQSLTDLTGIVNQKNRKILKQILELHVVRIDEMIKNSGWQEASETSLPILEYFYLFFEENAFKSRQFIPNQIHNHLSIISEQRIAPELKHQIYEKLLVTLSMPSYYHNSYPDILDVLQQLEPKKISTDEIKTIIESKIQNTTPELKGYWIFKYFTFLIRMGQYDFITFFSNYMETDDIVVRFAEAFSDYRHYKTEIRKIFEAKIRFSSHSLLPELSQEISKFAIQTNDEKLYEFLLVTLISSELSPWSIKKDVNLTEVCVSGLFPIVVKQDKIRTFLKSNFHQEYISSLISHGCLDEAENELLWTSDLVNISALAGLILKTMDKHGKELIISIVIRYLENYAGEQSGIQIENLFKHLNKEGHSELVNELTETISNKFSQRETLIDRIKIFQN